MTKMLYDGKMLMTGRTVTFTTELAMLLGHERQAMLLQQVHYWLYLIQHEGAAGGKFEDGRWWMHQKMHVWRQRFGFMSVTTIKRVRKHLEETGLLLRKDEADPTAEGGVRIWYSIDYDKLSEYIDQNTRQEGG